MEITFLKNHLNNKAGETISVSDERGNYLIRTGVAEKSVLDGVVFTRKVVEAKKIETKRGRKSKK